jgi:AraC-like DNA-binding protein
LNKRDANLAGVGESFRTQPGILYANTAGEKFQYRTLQPASELVPFVENYWTVSWDLRGEPPFTQRVLARPGVNMTFKAGRSRIAGLTTGRFAEVLEGRHRVFGVRFRTGGFRAFLGAPVALITDRFLGVSEVFGQPAQALEDALLRASDEEGMAAIMDRFLGPLAPRRDRLAEVAGEIVAAIAADRGLIRVGDLAAGAGMGPRRLQRLFHEYVGAGPKWVMRRYRMQEALARTAGGEPGSWGELAAELGYADQAHFIRDFTASVGTTPSCYVRLLAQGER